jgi:hypothetical protein
VVVDIVEVELVELVEVDVVLVLVRLVVETVELERVALVGPQHSVKLAFTNPQLTPWSSLLQLKSSDCPHGVAPLGVVPGG